MLYNIMRACLFHPTEQAVSHSGHVHINTPIGEKCFIVGLCKKCMEWEYSQSTLNAIDLANSEEGCKGCYGKVEHFR